MSKVLYETESYTVQQVDVALGEDGKYGQPGYGVVNKQTDVVEHTSMMLPGAIFQCQHFNDTLESLLAKPEEVVEPVDLRVVDVEDVVPN